MIAAFRLCGADADHPIFAHLPKEEAGACCIDLSTALLKFSTVALAVGHDVVCAKTPCVAFGRCVAASAAKAKPRAALALALAPLPCAAAAGPTPPPAAIKPVTVTPPGSPATSPGVSLKVPRPASDEKEEGWIDVFFAAAAPTAA